MVADGVLLLLRVWRLASGGRAVWEAPGVGECSAEGVERKGRRRRAWSAGEAVTQVSHGAVKSLRACFSFATAAVCVLKAGWSARTDRSHPQQQQHTGHTHPHAPHARSCAVESEASALRQRDAVHLTRVATGACMAGRGAGSSSGPRGHCYPLCCVPVF